MSVFLDSHFPRDPKSMTSFVPTPPKPDEAFEFYSTYLRLVPSGNLFEMATDQVEDLMRLSQSLGEESASVIHPPYQWTIKQVIGHMIDTERIFGGRLHRFACGDFQPLPGMDQEPYVANCDYNAPRIGDLIAELCDLRRANVRLMQRLKPSQWDHRGVASGHPVTVRALGYMMVGHITYHMQIIEKRLLTPRE